MSVRIPPQNLEAEMAVLGALMVDSFAWNEIAGLLSEEDFYKHAHQRIFSAILDLASRNLPIDLLTVSNNLTERKEIDAAGGPAYLAELMNSTPSSAHITSYAQIVHERAVLRQLIRLSSDIIEKSFSESFDDVESFLDHVESQIFSLAERKKQSGLTSAAELVKMSMDRLTELYGKQSEHTGVPSGFHALDRMTSGFQPGELVIIAARPSMGKTAFSLNIAQHAAIEQKKCVAYFSVEMAKEQMMMRMLASEARVNLGDIRLGNVNENAWPRVISQAAKIAEAKIFIDDTSGISPFEVRAKCRRLQAQYGLDLLMIDYLQLMEIRQKVESRERMISEISRTLKAIAKELKIPVIALAQLNRAVEGRSDRRPMLSDLRESGSIEQDADVIMMLYREDYYDRDNPDIKGLSEVIIAKQRNGPTGTVKLRWESSIGRFMNLDSDQGASAGGSGGGGGGLYSPPPPPSPPPMAPFPPPPSPSGSFSAGATLPPPPIPFVRPRNSAPSAPGSTNNFNLTDHNNSDHPDEFE